VLGREVVRSTATPGEGLGRYEARLDLPRTGEWVVTIDSGFGANSRLTLLPIAAVPRGGASARAHVGLAERGRQLFVAKGCVTCHDNALGSSNATIGIGPALVPQKYPPAFLASILASPETALPARADGLRMPNLSLQPKEIDSLVAFINATTVTASR
jgi:mono/diheme cytochrome c family protein